MDCWKPGADDVTTIVTTDELAAMEQVIVKTGGRLSVTVGNRVNLSASCSQAVQHLHKMRFSPTPTTEDV